MKKMTHSNNSPTTVQGNTNETSAPRISVRMMEWMKETEDECDATTIEGQCSRTWDGLLCWNTVPASTLVVQRCADTSALSLPVNDSDYLAYRVCSGEGEWTQNTTHYDHCMRLIRYLDDTLDQANIFIKDKTLGPLYWRTHMKQPGQEGPDEVMDDDRKWYHPIMRDVYFYGGILSLLLLLTTLFIFCYFRCLKCNRITIHKYLVTSHIIRCVYLILLFEPAVTNRKHHLYVETEWACKLMTGCLQHYTILSNIFWAFVEGLYLHNRIAVAVFSTSAPFPLFHFIGWGLPAIVVAAWAVAMELVHSGKYCWQPHNSSWLMLVFMTPGIGILFVNILFLANILRIVVTRVRARSVIEYRQVSRTVKATFILLPLLGITQMFFFVRYNTGLGTSLYFLTNCVLQTSQGPLISVLYCFCNAEVQTALRNRWIRYRQTRYNLSRRKSCTSHSSYLLSHNMEQQTALRTVRFPVTGRRHLESVGETDYEEIQPPEAKVQRNLFVHRVSGDTVTEPAKPQMEHDV